MCHFLVFPKLPEFCIEEILLGISLDHRKYHAILMSFASKTVLRKRTAICALDAYFRHF
jgi:hypothetical protein